mgnify:CR=1 FL=1
MFLWEDKDPEKMSEAERYRIYTQAEIEAMFSLSPSGTGCITNYMAIVTAYTYDADTKSTLFTPWNSTFQDVSLNGTFGDHFLKLDKTSRRVHWKFQVML